MLSISIINEIIEEFLIFQFTEIVSSSTGSSLEVSGGTVKNNGGLYVHISARNSNIGTSTTLWFTATSILISLTSLMYNILK